MHTGQYSGLNFFLKFIYIFKLDQLKSEAFIVSSQRFCDSFPFIERLCVTYEEKIAVVVGLHIIEIE